MTDADKTVFISYRRDVSAFIARAVFMDLRANGFDAFMDVESIDSGAFDTVILNQIAARAHFVLILTPGSVERCNEPGDWLRREIETAIDLGRNIVPLLVNNFAFKNAEAYLTGKLSVLPRYNALDVPHSYFDEAMARLRTRFLKQPLGGVISETPQSDELLLSQKLRHLDDLSVPSESEIIAEEYFAIARQKQKRASIEDAIDAYTRAIQLNPVYGVAYFNRGKLLLTKKMLEEALRDFNQAINLGFENAELYLNRGLVFHTKERLQEAIDDYTTALAFNTNFAYAYINRGEVYFALQDYKLALSDFRKANEMKIGDLPAIAGLAITRHALGEDEKSLKLWKTLLKTPDTKFDDLAWVKEELNWADVLVDEARKLLSKLKG